MAAISVDGVTKKFGDVVALQNLDMTVNEGEIYGFLGPNGAGKSTTIKILLNFVQPTEGTVTVLGRNAQTESLAIRQRVGVLPEGFEPYARLTGREHLSFTVESKRADDDPDEILSRVRLDDATDKKAGTYSTGMKQRLGLGIALVGDPDLLLLDEPTARLDPKGARRMREIVAAERDRGATVVFSSHILEQVEAVCDRVGILDDGQLRAADDIDSLRESIHDGETFRIEGEALTEETVAAVEAVDGVYRASLESGVLVVDCAKERKTAVLRAVEETGVVIEDFSLEEPSLEQLFETYTSGEEPAREEASA